MARQQADNLSSSARADHDWEVAARTLEAARAVVIICHTSPDGDCVGGMLGLGHALGRMGMAISLFAPDPVPAFLDFLPGFDEIVVAPATFPEADTVVLLEAPTLSRIDPIWTSHAAALQASTLMNLDHHATNSYYASVNLVRPETSSVCEMLFWLLRRIGAPLDERAATCVLAGIVSDTRSFRTSGVTPRTLETVAELVKLGADLFSVSDAVSRTRSAASLQLWGCVLSNLHREGPVLAAAVTQELVAALKLGMEEAEGLAEFLSDTRDVGVAIVLKENLNGSVRVSTRSDGNVDVAKLCAMFGGGGHPRAAGCTLTGPIADARDRFLAALRAINPQPAD